MEGYLLTLKNYFDYVCSLIIYNEVHISYIYNHINAGRLFNNYLYSVRVMECVESRVVPGSNPHYHPFSQGF